MVDMYDTQKLFTAVKQTGVKINYDYDCKHILKPSMSNTFNINIFFRQLLHIHLVSSGIQCGHGVQSEFLVERISCVSVLRTSNKLTTIYAA